MIRTFSFVVLLGCTFHFGIAQKNNSLSFQGVKSDLRANALKLGLQFLPSLDSMFSDKEILIANHKSLFQLAPNVDVQSGNKDVFSCSSIKLTGFFLFFNTTTIAGHPTPDLSRTFHVLPFSAGVEANRDFSIVNMIAEAGYFPWYQQPRVKIWEPLKKTKLGIFVQGGYKSNPHTNNTPMDGGTLDQSHEAVNNGVFRIKSNLSFDTGNLLGKGRLVGFGFVGDSNVWYDVLNSAVYYRIDAKLRFYFTKEFFYDLGYERGSGAPNFNQGDQFGMGLTVAF